MKKTFAMMALITAASLMTACSPQTSPSMMNTSRPQLVPQTTMQQIPVDKVSDGYLHAIAESHARYGTDGVQLALAYDPKSKTYNAMKAFNDLAGFKERLRRMGVSSITAETVKAEGSVPTLMVSYDGVSAQAPEGCRNMPGFDDGLTTRFIGDYKFGCSIDTALAKQIYRPTDLQGNAAFDEGDGRRAANTVEYYKRVTEQQATGELQRLDRSDLQAQ